METTNNYKRVYFRINTPSYYNLQYGIGFSNEDEGNLFYQAITEVFLNDGWEIKKEKYSNGNRIIKNKQELYLHPQNVSGVVLEEEIDNIKILLMTNNVFQFRKTDIYEDVYDIADDEYVNILESKKDDIAKDILTAFKTKRKNLFITTSYSVLDRVLDKYRIKRLPHYIGVRTSSDIDVQWIGKLFECLVTDGKITTAQTRNGTGYRSVA